MQKQLGRKRRHSGDQDALSSKGRKERPGSQRPPGPPSLAQLRAERLRREAAERARAEALLARVRGQVPQGPAEDQEELDERRRQYNSQYHPQLARRARGQAPQPTPF
ncbi:leukocyte receptor cluster member 1 homolog [Ochotona curzoniae]|uniref:leukocyte receptor cluster member 1 homolog n=1 Tax=Ochotona curzoniae TaxID=130825 RepID=UPI001B346BCE|nr:leukocyte receptor cluster member 1 homolog [Ochotona curzoniae]